MTWKTAILLAFGLLAGTGGGYAMQNPIYNGVNRIALSCEPEADTGTALCEALGAVLKARLRMPVTLQADAQPGNALGVLRVRLETMGDADPPRFRLVWMNDLKMRGGPASFEGAWIGFDGELARHNDYDALAEALTATRP